jgi:hypothetical protein
MFTLIAALTLVGLLAVVAVVLVRGARKAPHLESDVDPSPLALSIHRSSVVCVRKEGHGDTVRCVAREDAQAWALVDGLTDEPDVERAVQQVADVLESSLRVSAPWASLCEGVTTANRALFGDPSPRARPGVGVAVLAREGPQLHIGHAGLVRVFRVRPGLVDLLTVDHSPIGDMIRQRQIPHEKAESLLEDPGVPHRRVASRALGKKPEIELATRSVELAPGDTFVVASANVGLSLSRAAIVEAFAATSGDLRALPATLLHGPGMRPSMWGSRGVIVVRCG